MNKTRMNPESVLPKAPTYVTIPGGSDTDIIESPKGRDLLSHIRTCGSVGGKEGGGC